MRRLSTPRGIIIHHSLTKDTGTVSWLAIRRYHRLTKGWDDIGYHFGVEQVLGPGTGEHGTLEAACLIGRPPSLYGAHTLGRNDHLGLCVVGNFDLAQPPTAVWDAAVVLVAHLLWVFWLQPRDVTGHRDHANKSCPGTYFSMDLFKREVTRKLRKLHRVSRV